MTKIKTIGLSLVIFITTIFSTSCLNNEPDHISLPKKKVAIADTENKILTEVKFGMSKMDIHNIFGEQHYIESGLDTMSYYVLSLPVLDQYVNLVNSNYKCDAYKYEYEFKFSDEDQLYEWVIEADEISPKGDILNCVKNTFIPILKKECPSLKEDDVDSDDFYASGSGNDSKFGLTLRDLWGIEVSDFQYYNSKSNKSGNYDKSDKYYSNNDSDNDGYINDDEFQNAVGDWMDDNGY